MSGSEKIINQSDSLIELLTAQCADLENLLALARCETVAAEQKDFEEILRIVTERGAIGQRLETFQQQIIELRGFLGAQTDNFQQNEIAKRVVEVANLTLIQDRKTKLLLTGVCESVALEMQNTEKSFRGTSAYLSEARKGLACDQSF